MAEVMDAAVGLGLEDHERHLADSGKWREIVDFVNACHVDVDEEDGKLDSEELEQPQIRVDSDWEMPDCYMTN
jgi:hypothetical protein